MQKLFDIKILVVAIITAFGWGGNYFTISTKVDKLEEKSNTHVSKEVFAVNQAYNEQQIADLQQRIDKIYERFGWVRFQNDKRHNENAKNNQ